MDALTAAKASAIIGNNQRVCRCGRGIVITRPFFTEIAANSSRPRRFVSSGGLC
jgi:hypothetical protein